MITSHILSHCLPLHLDYAHHLHSHNNKIWMTSVNSWFWSETQCPRIINWTLNQRLFYYTSFNYVSTHLLHATSHIYVYSLLPKVLQILTYAKLLVLPLITIVHLAKSTWVFEVSSHVASFILQPSLWLLPLNWCRCQPSFAILLFSSSFAIYSTNSFHPCTWLPLARAW